MAKSVNIEKVLKEVLLKKGTKPLKFSKVQSKVHKKLSKRHKEVTEQQTHELIKEVLSTSRTFSFDGKKVQLAPAPAAVVPAAEPVASAAPTALDNGAPQLDHKRKRHEDGSTKHRKKQKQLQKVDAAKQQPHETIKHEHDADKREGGQQQQQQLVLSNKHEQQQKGAKKDKHRSQQQPAEAANAQHHQQQPLAQQQLHVQQHSQQVGKQQQQEKNNEVKDQREKRSSGKHKEKHKEKRVGNGDEHKQQQQQQQQRNEHKAGTDVPDSNARLEVGAAKPTTEQQEQQPAPAGVAVSSARARLQQAMQGIRQQSTPAAAAAVAHKQQQSAAAKPAAGRHTVLASPPAGSAAAALAAVQSKLAAKQQREEGDGEDTPDKKEQRIRRSDSWRADYNRTDIKHGRFNESEREAIHAAVVEYAEEKGLPHEKGECDWLIDRKLADVKKGAITAIAAAVPHRTRKAVWQFVQANYAAVETGGVFTADEDAKLLELYSELGPRWKEIAGRMGRLDRSVRDRAKALNYGKEKITGRWSEEEVDTLLSFVSAYRQALAASGATEGEGRHISTSLLPDEDTQPRPVGNVHLDDIDWEWVSTQMGTRTAKQCAERWHKRMAPSMIESGQWAPGDDTTMITALAAAEASEAFQVNWDQLVPGRTAQQCKRRWLVILRHLPVEVRQDFTAAVAEAAARMKQRQQKKKAKKKGSRQKSQ